MEMIGIQPWRRMMSRWLTGAVDTLATLCTRHWLVALDMLLGMLLGAVVGVAAPSSAWGALVRLACA